MWTTLNEYTTSARCSCLQQPIYSFLIDSLRQVFKESSQFPSSLTPKSASTPPICTWAIISKTKHKIRARLGLDWGGLISLPHCGIWTYLGGIEKPIQSFAVERPLWRLWEEEMELSYRKIHGGVQQTHIGDGGESRISKYCTSCRVDTL